MENSNSFNLHPEFSSPDEYYAPGESHRNRHDIPLDAETVATQAIAGQLEVENRQLKELAYTDELTGLPNRRQLTKDLQRMIAQEPGRVGVIFFDIDNLKETNDADGHRVGDGKIWTTAKRIRELTRHNNDELSGDRRQNEDIVADDTVGRGTYRLSGDELVVLLAGVNSEDDVNGIVSRLRHQLVEVDGYEISLAGALHNPVEGQSTRDAAMSLIAAADTKMSRQKDIHRLETNEQIMPEVKLVAEIAESTGKSARQLASLVEAYQRQQDKS